jgi:LacI family transcriptional regulator
MKDLKLEDIAELAGVSRSTVSRVVNNHPNVSEGVRKRVLKVIQNTGYQPNAAARSLASQRSWMIGLVLPRTTSSFFTDPYFPQLTQGIAFACNNNDLTLSLFLVGNLADEEKITPRISRRGMFDGVLIQSGPSDDRLIQRLVSSPVPCIVLGRPLIQESISYIDVDNISAAKKATHHLIKLGYKHIGMITGSKNSSVSIDRREGYLKALADAGREVDESLIVEGDFSESSGYVAMHKLMPGKPDAIFAQSDIMAIGAMRAVQEAGLQIPQDIAFVGFDDLPIASLSKIKLTTIRQPITKFGIKAVELLLDVIENGAKPARRLILETELIIRDSCGSKINETRS